MPGYDGTGPEGSGPNGRGYGPCGRGTPRYYGRGFFGFHRGGRGGGRRGFWWSRPFVNTIESLESEKNWLEQQLNTVKNKLNEIDQE